ncbi:MAG: HAMP domain-containing histidine kinase [Bacilli bacterium]|nr:HAMP domain-containing histidine kinase [Bacilli bacterium]
MTRRKEIQLLFWMELFFVGILWLFTFFGKISDLTFWIVLFAILVVDIFFFIVLYHEGKEIEKLSFDMNRILNGDYSIGIRDYEEGDISNLKNDIYKMTIKLREQVEQSRKDKKYLEEILSDISHQIKTPLTSMYVINDLFLEDQNMAFDLKREFLLKNRMQLERIEWLVSSLLKMSRLDSGVEPIKKRKIKSSELVQSVIEPLKIPIELKEQTLEIVNLKDPLLWVDPNWTREAFVNMLKNAHEHTPEGGVLRIEVNETPLYFEFLISDTGCDISKEDLPHIFERFYKGGGSKESIGIGLHMAKKIIMMQQGDIKVVSSSKGTTFNIKFYKKNY